jgi:hypothetical protein
MGKIAEIMGNYNAEGGLKALINRKDAKKGFFTTKTRRHEERT